MEHHYVTLASNIKIHTLLEGNPSNPPLVLVHGWPSSSDLWRHMIPELSKHFYILVPDLPGHGKSDKPLSVSYDRDFYCRFLLDFFDAFNLKTANLAVHDLGGMAGISFAVRHPDRLAKFIVMDTSPYKDIPLLLHLSLYFLKINLLTRFFLTRWVFALVLKNGFHNKKIITPELVDRFRSPWGGTKEGVKAFANTIKIPIHQLVESTSDIKKIDIPTLILWGRNDFFFPLKIARQLHKDIKQSTLVSVEKAGHFLQEEQPQFIQEQMIDFLQKQETA